MSLNGLDSAAIAEAYQSALTDAGGWFLLHYVSRDEVALFLRGTSGVPEVRNAIEKYEEISPLYGFLQYRRRKVILRYMPEGLSRLILARSNVQFQSILDKFSNDTTLTLTLASDLNESALSSACLLHTASGSITSSSSSLRRRKLMEITEDAEENGAPKDTEAPTRAPPSVPAPTDTRERPGSQRSEITVVPLTASSSLEQSPDLRSPPSRASSRPPPSREGRSESRQSMAPTSPVSSERSKYRNILDEFPRPSEEVRISTQSARPSLRELERAAGYTPKVKLGPRPSLDQAGRPRTSGSSKLPDQRPVASLPAGMRSSTARKQLNMVEAPRPRSQGSSFASKPITRAPPIPPLLVPPPNIPISRPPLSPGAKSLGALSTSSGLTPEKERLMKALQQRKKNMAKRAEDTKRKQSMAPVMEKSPDPPIETPQNLDENKENTNVMPETEKEERNPPIPDTQPTEPPLTTSVPAPAHTSHEVLETPAEPVDVPPIEHHIEQNRVEEQVPTETPVEKDTAEPEIYLQPRAFSGFYSAPKLLPEDPIEDALPVHQEVEQDATPDEEPRQDLTNEATLSDSERGGSSHISRPSADTTSSNASGDALETTQLDTPQTVLEDETGEVSTSPDHTEYKEDLVAPSAPSEVPLSEVPDTAQDSEPEAEHVSPSISSDALAVVNDEPEVASVEQHPQEPIASANGLVTPPPESPSPSATETPIARVAFSIDPAPTEETTSLEAQSVEKPESLPLDQRRKVQLEPIQIAANEYSDDDNLLSDDSFIEELRSATVQEARPVAVKSPSSNNETWKSSPRAFSSSHGSRSPSVMQTLSANRSASSSHADLEASAPLMAKKVNVSSGISSRIKALEKFQTSREGTPVGSSPAVTVPSSSSSFESLRKRASVSIPNGALPDFSRAPSVHRSDSHAHAPSSRRASSISSTVHFGRDRSHSPNPSAVEADPDAQENPLAVEHDGVHEPENNQEPANHSDSRRVSIDSMASSHPALPSRSASRISQTSPSGNDGNAEVPPPSEEKKESRTSRLMRRMSSMTSSSRRSIIGTVASPVKEEGFGQIADESASSSSPSRQKQSAPIEIGEVNVQFPDTLLWKRRCILIDEEGYLVITPGTNDSTARNMTKRYHLNEFRTPCLPDEDMQEMPNSILLDFLDGSTLQCACESRHDQTTVLQTLVDAHKARQS